MPIDCPVRPKRLGGTGRRPPSPGWASLSWGRAGRCLPRGPCCRLSLRNRAWRSSRRRRSRSPGRSDNPACRRGSVRRASNPYARFGRRASRPCRPVCIVSASRSAPLARRYGGSGAGPSAVRPPWFSPGGGNPSSPGAWSRSREDNRRWPRSGNLSPGCRWLALCRRRCGDRRSRRPARAPFYKRPIRHCQ